MEGNKPRILLLDIETSPAIGYAWAKWDTNIIEFTQHWYILSFAVKWFGEKNTIVKALSDYKKCSPQNDKELVKDLWRFFDEADVIIAHNGDQFDIKKCNTRFTAHNLTPPSPYRTIDTLKVARKFGFMSNKLDDLCQQLGIGAKVKHEGFGMWKGCMADEPESWALMKKYNKHDTDLLEKLYIRFRPWIVNHPNLATYMKVSCCPACGSKNLRHKGYRHTQTRVYKRFICYDCGKYGRSSASEFSATTGNA
jgi:hypothetical protein